MSGMLTSTISENKLRNRFTLLRNHQLIIDSIMNGKDYNDRLITSMITLVATIGITMRDVFLI